MGQPSANSRRSTPRRRRRLRWLLLLAVILVIGAIGVVVGLRALLASDWLRAEVERTLERQTGLQIRVPELELGWRGRSTARRVEVRLPLDGSLLATLDRVRVRHAWIGLLAATRDPGLERIDVEGCRLHVVQDARGEWSAARAVEAMRAAAAKQPSSSRAALPVVRLRGTVRIAPQSSSEFEEPLHLDLAPDGAAAAVIDTALGALHVKGRVAIASGAAELDIAGAGLERYAAVAGVKLAQPVSVRANVRASATDLGVELDVGIERAAIGGNTLAGRMGLVSTSNGISGTLRDVSVALERGPAKPLRITTASARLTPGAWTLNHAVIEAFAARASISGAWDPTARTGRVEVIAERGAADGDRGGVAGDASISLTIRAPRVGDVEAVGAVRSQGTAASAAWRGEVNVRAWGRSLDSVHAEIAAPALVAGIDAQSFSLSGTSLSASLQWPYVRVGEIRVPSAGSSTAAGTYDLVSGAWALAMSIDDLRDARVGSEPISLAVEATGQPGTIDVASVRARRGDVEISGAGRYDVDAEPPLTFDASINARVTTDAVSGDANASLRAAGTLDPLAIGVSGEMSTKTLKLKSGAGTGPTVAPFRALVMRDAVSMTIPETDMLGGCVAIDAAYLASSATAVASVRADRVPLAQLGALTGVDVTAGGELGARVTLATPVDSIAQSIINGTVHLADGALAGVRVGDAQARISAADGQVSLTEIEVTQEAGGGVIRGSVAWRDGVAAFDAHADGWRVEHVESGLVARASGSFDGDINTTTGALRGSIDVATDNAKVGSVPLHVALEARVDGPSVEASRIEIEALGARLRGKGSSSLNDWTTARADLVLEQLDLARGSPLIDERLQLGGIASGSVTIGPTPGDHPLEPMRVAADLRIVSGRLRGMALGDVSVVMYAGKDRVVLDQSDVAIAGGAANIWARLSRHDAERFLQVNLRASELDANQLVHAAQQEMGNTPGKVDVRATLGGYLGRPHRAFGEALITVRESDLQPIPAFATLYSILNVDLNKPEATGEGEALLRLEGDALRIARFQYFNRGTDINGAGEIADITDIRRSDVSGALIATLRPLKGSRLPFGPELDSLLGTVLRDAASVRISGTADQPRISVVPFDEVVSFFRGIFGSGRPTP